MPVINEGTHEGRWPALSPRFSYPELIIPSGRAAHIGNGWWLKRCAAPWCNVAWVRLGGFYVFEREHGVHEATHNIDVPGFNVGLLEKRNTP